MSQDFILDPREYDRDLNFVKTYTRDAVAYICKMRGCSKEEATNAVKAIIGKGGVRPLKNPRVLYLEQETLGNRVKKTGTLLGYLKDVSSRKLTMSPTMTAYSPPSERRSVTAMYIADGLAKRSKNKKLMLRYKSANDEIRAGIFNNRQQRNKIKNNSMSGAHGTPSSVLFVKSAHSSLTSTCRSASSSTNANVDRLLTGNRHYWSADIAINNIMNCIGNSDLELIATTMLTYGIVAPSVELTRAIVKESCDLYWTSAIMTAKIDELIGKLSGVERAAFLYSSDLYSIAKSNPEVVRDIFWHLCTLPDEPTADDVDYFSLLEDDETALVCIIADPIIKSRNYWAADVKADPEYGRVQACAKRVLDGLTKYFEFFRVFWLNRNVAASMAVYPTATRRAIVASDTDSSIFTNQDWVEWYQGKVTGSQESFNVAATSTYLCSKLTSHVLAVMSGSMGVEDEHLRLLQMKNEYAFKFFGLTTMAKHYFATMDAQEGNVYLEKDVEMEIKGVTLRNSAAPKELVVQSNQLIKDIALKVSNDIPMELTPILQDIADKEHRILNSIKRGDPHYFRQIRINSADSYKNENSVFLHKPLWDMVWSHRLGPAPDPTYQAMVIKTTINSKTDWEQWIDKIKDTKVVNGLEDFCAKYNKKALKSFNLPYDIIKASGIPEELLEVMDIRNMVRNLMKSFYLILESLGYFALNKKGTRLISDDFPPSPELKLELGM